MTAARRHTLLGIAAVLAATLAPVTYADDPPPPVSRVERGPVTMEVRLDRSTLAVGDKLTLEVQVAAPRGIAIEMPDVGSTLGPFAVRGARTPPDVPDGAARRWTHTWVLDTFSTGEMEIPPLIVSFTDTRPEVATAGEPVEGTVESGPLPVTVRSVLAEDATAADARPIAAAASEEEFAIWQIMRARQRWWAAGIITGVALLAGAVAALVLWRRLRPTPAPPPIPCDVEALEALERLSGEALVERQRFEEFYVRLSGIVRRYIERRFAIMAPERTTDEFLAEARRSDQLDDTHKTHLRDFLRVADMVKFARHEPQPAECATALSSAVEFVEQTRPRVTGEAGPPRDTAVVGTPAEVGA